MKNLYEITGSIADINTLLVNKAEYETLATDATRLEWAVNNMSQHNYILFGMHVMNAGGAGDIDDCRDFIDNRIKEST